MFVQYIPGGFALVQRLSDQIEAYLKGMVQHSDDGVLEIRRSSIAEYFSCVPSQVTYVLGTRFTMERGYLVESRRGGGGFVRIRRLKMASLEQLLDVLSQLRGTGISQTPAFHVIARLEEDRLITGREALLMREVLSGVSLAGSPNEDFIRERLLRSMIRALAKRS